MRFTKHFLALSALMHFAETAHSNEQSGMRHMVSQMTRGGHSQEVLKKPDCLASVNRGLMILAQKKTLFDEARDFMISAEQMKTDAGNVSKPIYKVLKLEDIQSPELKNDIMTAVHLTRIFEDTLEEADGEKLKAALKKVCVDPRGPIVNLEEDLYKLISREDASAILTILRSNAKWSKVKSASFSDYAQSLIVLGHGKPKIGVINGYIADLPEKFNKMKKDAGVTEQEFKAISDYTYEGYEFVNPILRKEGQEAKKLPGIKPYLDTANNGLSKLPNHIGTVTRGGTLPDAALQKHKVGSVVEYDAFTSASKTKAFGGKHKFIIQSYTGKYIAPYSSRSDEEEVLFRSGTRFKVLHIEDKENNEKIFYMQEIFLYRPSASD